MASPRPLSGKRVVELSQFIAGPTAAQWLADFGAEVIKVEAPGGDGSRALPGTAFGSVYARTFNTGKASIVIDTRQEEDRQRLFALIAQADALVCNLAPGALRRLGLDAAGIRARFPGVVVTLISGYGQDDDRTCMDTIAQCESGFAFLNGDADGTPRISTSWPTDFFCGLYAGSCTAMALCDPALKDGTLIDITMMEVATAMLLGPAALMVAEGGRLGSPAGNRDRASAPSNIYPCQDGHVYIYGGLDPYWAKLRTLTGGEMASMGERLSRAEEFDALVAAWTSARSRAEVLEAMRTLAIPAGIVREPQEAVAAIRAMRPGAVTQPLESGEHVPSFPALFDGARLPRTPAPAVGGPRRGG